MSESRPPSAPEQGPRAPPPTPPQGAVGLTPAPGRAADTIPRHFGRYRLLDRVGKGGMGAVFRAHDTQLDRAVALKVPFLGEDDTEMRQRFLREARAAAALHHPNICPVFDVGEFQGLPYLTMAFVEGRSLAKVLEDGPLAPARAAQLVRKVALAMREAHQRGVIHRDLKPANVMLRPDGEPVVMDFGLARRADDRGGEALTRKGDVIGTLEYMPPEQLDGDNAAVGPAADIYALGVVLYELLTGRRPFAGSTVSMLTAILLKPPPRPSEIRPGVPGRLEEVCLKAMARRPEDRYATMGHLAAALADYLRCPQPDSAPTVIRSTPAAPTPTPGGVTKPIRAEAVAEPAGRPAPAAGGEPPPPAAPPPPPRSSGRRPRSSARRKKSKAKRASYLPFAVGGGVLALVCLGVLAAVIAARPRGEAASAGAEEPAPAPSPPAGPPPAPARRDDVRPTPPAGADAGKKAGAAADAAAGKKSQPDPKPAPALALRCRPDAATLAVGEQREVTVHVERGSAPGAVVLSWTGPPGLHVSPPGPLTVKPGEPDPVLKVRLTAEPAGEDPRLVITAAPDRGPAGAAATTHLAVRVTPGPCSRVLDLADRPDAAVEAVAFAPDASLALVGGGGDRKDGGKGPAESGDARYAVRVWDLARGEAVGSLTGHAGPVTELAVSADGKTALSVSDDETVALWDLARGRRESQSPRQPLRVLGVGVGPDARRALVLYPGLVVKVDLEKFRAFGQPIKTAQLTGSDLPDVLRTAAVSAGGQGLVGGLDGKLFLLDLAEKTKPRPLAGHREAVLCAAFSPSGESAATGGGGVLRVGTLQPGQENLVCLWDVGAAALRWKAEGHARPVTCVAFSPDGRLLASGGADGEVRVWRAEDGKPVASFAGHAGRVLGLAFTPDGKAVWSGAADRTLRRWRLP